MQRVFIVSKYIMFGHGLESLLSREAELEILGQESNIDYAIEQIEWLKPDVVIFDNDSSPQNSAPNIMRILNSRPDMRVIGLSLSDNNIHVYEATRWMAQNVEDLLGAITRQKSAASTETAVR